ncbi:MAG: class I SAM-dependent methyltransferase [Chloroflexi bacterium]|nr:MAG: class I SAM-dependent methyltransferase [Chloroflexota bacterium]
MNETELESWFANTQIILETAYIQHEEPWRQSGMSGPEERWISLRKPVADCIDHSGSFLDIGCANGYLLECILRWTTERGLQIEPYGLDISLKLLELAKKRFPQYADHFFRGNAFYWNPPHRFNFVRTELVYVPGDYERMYIGRLLEKFLKPGGKLLIANYMEGLPDPMKGLLPGSHPTRFIEDRLDELGIKATRFCDGYDPTKNRRIRVAVIDK